jgi:hypothetical protein
MRVPKPIPPIREQFSPTGSMNQGAVGFVTLFAFLRAWNEVRAERRERRRRAS